MAEVKVIGFWPSPFVMRPRIALHMKSVESEYIEDSLQPKSELLLKSNPVHKKIPVLLHNDKPICESLIIVEYIDEAFPSASGPSILPSDPYDRAIQRFWAAYIDDKWFPTFRELLYSQNEELQVPTIEKVKEGLALFEDAFVKCSKGKPFFSGDKIGHLDIVLGSYIGWLRAVAKMRNIVEFLNEEETPNLFTWSERFCADDAVKEYMPETDKLMEFGKLLQAKLKAEAATQS